MVVSLALILTENGLVCDTTSRPEKPAPTEVKSGVDRMVIWNPNYRWTFLDLVKLTRHVKDINIFHPVCVYVAPHAEQPWSLDVDCHE